MTLYYAAEANPDCRGWGIYRRRRGRTRNLFRLVKTYSNRETAVQAAGKLNVEEPEYEYAVQCDKEQWMLPERYEP